MSKPRTHVVTGDRSEVLAALARAHEDGRLVSVADCRELSGGRVQVVAQLLGDRSRWERSRPWLIGLANVLSVLVALAVVAGLVWLLVLGVLELIALVAMVAAWVQANWLLLVLGAVGVLWLLMGGGGCPGIHCGGCRG